ncbi:sulfur carrier protein [Pacificibacter maritimus]|uniref:Sulfur carrier protein n=1 Tax=Pacificibacter maritimus TaxID=762213 RepID=A0A3N4UVK6_9RHOB|nr:sulfur carrier protein ThiS [Pacificibacter maritimus]RPE71521.1 sulfur carrier protein [Pacificibacter maritimus]
MKITVNSIPHDVTGPTLHDLLVELGYITQGQPLALATALNDQFIAKSDRHEIALYSGDRVEILTPMQGG